MTPLGGKMSSLSVGFVSNGCVMCPQSSEVLELDLGT